jgi:hypothetical protein
VSVLIRNAGNFQPQIFWQTLADFRGEVVVNVACTDPRNIYHR